MHIQSIILLIISLMLVIISSWNFSVFTILKNVSNQYTSNDLFDNACHVSKNYVKIGYTISIIILIISILLMILASFSIYKNYS
jgi:hypothetical protein